MSQRRCRNCESRGEIDPRTRCSSNRQSQRSGYGLCRRARIRRCNVQGVVPGGSGGAGEDSRTGGKRHSFRKLSIRNAPAVGRSSSGSHQDSRVRGVHRVLRKGGCGHRQRGGQRGGRSGSSRRRDGDRHCRRLLMRLRILHLQLSCARGRQTGAPDAPGQRICVDHSRRQRRAIPEYGRLGGKVRAGNPQGRAGRTRGYALRRDLSDAGGCRCLGSRLLGSAAASDAVKKKGEAGTQRDCLLCFAHINTPQSKSNSQPPGSSSTETVRSSHGSASHSGYHSHQRGSCVPLSCAWGRSPVSAGLKRSRGADGAKNKQAIQGQSDRRGVPK